MAREHALGPGSYDSCYLSQIFLSLFPNGFIVALRDIFPRSVFRKFHLCVLKPEKRFFVRRVRLDRCDSRSRRLLMTKMQIGA